MNEQRADPDALLASLLREGRGRLKIFLGAAPGVGKSWKMLAEAQRFRRAGLDVLAGVIETHGRAETQAQADGLPLLPRRPMPYRGHMLEEFDLDAALALRPALLLVDELAHDNAPGSRHAKRWEDVLELVAAGLTVWTTLNIQHLDSLNDDIVRITGVRVGETVPDYVLEQADEIELIDLSPADLRARLREGRIYPPDNAARALEGYFREGNLAALREMALRRTAAHVDHSVRGWMRANRVAGPWPVGERVLALVGPGASGEPVIRAARRLADALHAPLLALHVERPSAGVSSRPALSLAALLGAEIEVRSGDDLVAEILSAAASRNVSRIVIGRRSRRARWWRLQHRSLDVALLRRGGAYGLHVVADSPSPPLRSVARSPRRREMVGALVGWCGSGLAVLAVTAAGLWLPLLGRQETIGMVFLAVVVTAATLQGLGLAICTAIVAFLFWDFFFIAPVGTITISNLHDAVALGVFLIVAGLTGWLGGRVRAEARAGQNRIDSLRRIGAFSRRLGLPATEPELLAEIVSQAGGIGKDAVLLVPDESGGTHGAGLRVAAPEAAPALDPGSLAAARWSLSHQVETGRLTATLPSAAWRFMPLRGRDSALAVLGVRDRPEQPFDASALQALEALVDQASLALDRVRLTGIAARASAMEDTQKLRTALLNSLGHDLRTPLTGIRGAAETLRTGWSVLEEPVRADLLASIEQDTGRMTRFLADILDLTRLESGQIVPRLEPVAVRGAVEAAIARVPGAAYATVAGEPDCLVLADPMLLQQVLVNLLDNAAHYAPDWSHIAVRIASRAGEIIIEVADEGVGVPAEELPWLFESFFRGRNGDRIRPGTGLGLAIARGLVEAMGGTISATSPRPDVPHDAAPGTMMTIRLPAAGAAL